MAPRATVIVGASLCGGRAAETLRAEGYDGDVILIGAEPHRPYERPPLSKELLRGDAPPEKAFLRPPEYYVENSIELIAASPVTALDVGARTVTLSDGTTIPYESLLLATGARPRRPPIPGADLDGVHVLRSLEDATAIADALARGARVAVVGGGFIGCEVAASARARGCEVTIVEGNAGLLARALGPEVGEIVAGIHRDAGVKVRVGARIARIEGSARAEAVVLSDETRVPADLVVLGVGVTPADELARAAGLECDNGIVVDEHCRTSAPRVFAAGDVAAHPNAYSRGRVRLEHWHNAQNQGVAAARAILGATAAYDEVPWFWSDQYEHTIQMFGHALRWDRVVFRGDRGARAFAAFYMDGSSVAAALSIGRAKDARAGRDLIRARVDVADDLLATSKPTFAASRGARAGRGPPDDPRARVRAGRPDRAGGPGGGPAGGRARGAGEPAAPRRGRPRGSVARTDQPPLVRGFQAK